MKQTIKLSPIQAKEMTVAKNIENSSQILVDFTLFYEDHCKEHPIDLALKQIYFLILPKMYLLETITGVLDSS